MATSPPGAAGVVDVTVITPGGTSPVTLADRFTYGTQITVTGVGPASGPLVGGTTVTISGTNVGNATQVLFGTVPAQIVSVSPTQIVVTSPSGVAGVVDVTVTSPNGQSPTSAADHFTYKSSLTTVTGVAAPEGPSSGGDTVTITGTGFTGATQVDFGGVPASRVVVNSDSQITAVSPPGSGIVDVTVVTPQGSSATSPTDRFTYVVASVVTQISTTVGPEAGGTPVTITGTGFGSVAQVYFGATLASNIVVNSDTQITATSPAGAAGMVNVTVVTPGGTSPVLPAVQFTYVVPPVITALSTDKGRSAGGTTVTITGSGFNIAAQVYFGTALASNIVVNSETQITATSPAGAPGVADVTVAIPGGTSGIRPEDQFTYVIAPVISKFTASDGDANDAFGTSIAISGNTMVVGAPRAMVGSSSNQGEAYVFTKSSTGWIQTATLTVPASYGAANTYFGISVAISGNTIVVGAYDATVGFNSAQGAAYVFSGSGTSWTETARITASDGAEGDHFGHSVAISGGTIVVGAENNNEATGAAYVFTVSGTSWTQAAKLTASDGEPIEYFGSAVAISGSTVVVGELGSSGLNDPEAVYVFTASGSTWTQAAKLTAKDGKEGDGFGASLAISGSTIAIGAYGTNSFQGAAYVFTPSGSTWIQTATLTATDGQPYDGFGGSIAISDATILVRGPNAAYVFTRTGTSWSQTAKLTAPDGQPDDGFGGSVAVDGVTDVIGAS
ncbi:IPT/TIG domain-containing protein, partial [Singulisphaera rosea]